MQHAKVHDQSQFHQYPEEPGLNSLQISISTQSISSSKHLGRAEEQKSFPLWSTL